jgi:hypothetical protein
LSVETFKLDWLGGVAVVVIVVVEDMIDVLTIKGIIHPSWFCRLIGT